MLNIHWKDWCWCWSSNIWLPDMKSWPTGKDPDAGKDWGQKKKGATENEIVGWHHQLNGHEFEQTLGDRERHGSLMYCSSWGHSIGHNLATEQLSQEALWGDVFLLIWNKKDYKSKWNLEKPAGIMFSSFWRQAWLTIFMGFSRQEVASHSLLQWSTFCQNSEEYENSLNSMKRQKYDSERWTPQISRCPVCYCRRVEK